MVSLLYIVVVWDQPEESMTSVKTGAGSQITVVVSVLFPVVGVLQGGYSWSPQERWLLLSQRPQVAREVREAAYGK